MERLRQRADFLAVATGARAAAPAFTLQSRRRDDPGPIRIGFTVSRKNGTATERNRIRRRLREVVKRLDVIAMRPHSDYVLVGRRAALTRDFHEGLLDPVGVGPAANGARSGARRVRPGGRPHDALAEMQRLALLRRRARRSAGVRTTAEPKREREKNEGAHRA